MPHRQSLISAHHNYLVNRMLSPGFVLGNPGTREEFYFLADMVLPGESTPRISARLFDAGGSFLVELKWNRIGRNPGKCTYHAFTEGFRILDPTGEMVLEVRTQRFPNGYLSRIQGRLYDERGTLRMESMEGSIQVHGEARLALDTPYPENES